MREYKFRGANISTGSVVYGYFKKNRQGDCFIEDIDGLVTAVIPESVVPLVGRDINGQEVYEGDWLYDEFEEIYFHVIWDDVDNTFCLEGEDYCYDGSNLCRFELSSVPYPY